MRIDAKVNVIHYSVFLLSPIIVQIPICIMMLISGEFTGSFVVIVLNILIIFVVGSIPALITACYSENYKRKSLQVFSKTNRAIWIIQSILMGGFISFIYVEFWLLTLVRIFDFYGGLKAAVYGMICAGLSCVILLFLDWYWLKWKK